MRNRDDDGFGLAKKSTIKTVFACHYEKKDSLTEFVSYYYSQKFIEHNSIELTYNRNTPIMECVLTNSQEQFQPNTKEMQNIKYNCSVSTFAYGLGVKIPNTSDFIAEKKPFCARFSTKAINNDR